MGVFLHIGFVAKATAELPKTITLENVNEGLDRYYSEDTYDCKVSKKKVTWTLKPEVVQSELAAFAEMFYEDYHGNTNRRGIQETLAFIREISIAPDWLEQAKKQGRSHFLVPKYGSDESFEINEEENIDIDTTIIRLGVEGKFLMEEDECTLRFLEISAQKSFANFKLGKTIRAFVF